jgi:hypothetical protein
MTSLDVMQRLVLTDDQTQSWLYQKYYYGGTNSRYWTWQIALNLLLQRHPNPVIIETGCQRLPDDLDAGMSTSILGEYCHRHGGKLYTVDLFPNHLQTCRECTIPFAASIEYVESDSIAWLRDAKGIQADLLYLDSLDYPFSLDGRTWNRTEAQLSQEHCLNEFLAAEGSGKLKGDTIFLADDNQLLGGGKPRLLKSYLIERGWICLLDLQQSLWVREI